MLETIREYALEKLEEAGEVEATRHGPRALVRATLVDRAEPAAARLPSSATGSAACRPRRTT